MTHKNIQPTSPKIKCLGNGATVPTLPTGQLRWMSIVHFRTRRKVHSSMHFLPCRHVRQRNLGKWQWMKNEKILKRPLKRFVQFYQAHLFYVNSKKILTYQNGNVAIPHRQGRSDSSKSTETLTTTTTTTTMTTTTTTTSYGRPIRVIIQVPIALFVLPKMADSSWRTPHLVNVGWKLTIVVVRFVTNVHVNRTNKKIARILDAIRRGIYSKQPARIVFRNEEIC